MSAEGQLPASTPSKDDLLREVFEAIKAYAESDRTDVLIICLDLPRRYRNRVYVYVSTHFCGSLQYAKTKVQNDDKERYYLHVLKTDVENATKQLASLSAVTDDQLVARFLHFLKPGIPLSRAENLSYYLDLLEPYRQARTLFKGFQEDVSKMGGIGMLTYEIEQVMNRARDYLDPRLGSKVPVAGESSFRNALFESERSQNAMLSAVYPRKEALYIAENQDKRFISLDINKANFTMIRKYFPEVIGDATWELFMKRFDSHQLFTVRNSKFLRERLFGELGVCKRANMLSEINIRAILNAEKIPPATVVLLSGDEFVVHYTPDLYASLKKCYHNDMFKVLAFRLHKLPQFNYFVKEYFEEDISVIVKREFKCVPGAYLCECIKTYEGRKVLSLDRRYMAESGRVAEFIQPLFRHA